MAEKNTREFESKHQNAMVEWRSCWALNKWSMESKHILSSTQCFCYLGQLLERDGEQTMWNQKSGAQWTDSGKRVNNNNTNNSNSSRRRRHFSFDMLNTDTRCCYFAAENKIKWPRHEVSIGTAKTVFCCKQKQLHSPWTIGVCHFQFSRNRTRERKIAREPGQFMFFWLLLVQLKQFVLSAVFSLSAAAADWLNSMSQTKQFI